MKIRKDRKSTLKLVVQKDVRDVISRFSSDKGIEYGVISYACDNISMNGNTILDRLFTHVYNVYMFCSRGLWYTDVKIKIPFSFSPLSTQYLFSQFRVRICYYISLITLLAFFMLLKVHSSNPDLLHSIFYFFYCIYLFIYFYL